MTASLYALSLLALSLWGAESVSVASAVWVPGCVAVLSTCIYLLLRAGGWPTATVLIAFGLAYLPRSWDAAKGGILAAQIPVSPDGVQQALLLLAATAVLATAATLALMRVTLLRDLGRWLSSSASAQLPSEGLEIAVGLALAGPALSAFMDGTWSAYGWSDEERTGNVGLGALYRPMLAASAAVAGTWLTRLRPDAGSNQFGKRVARATAGLVLITLLFLTQSRRLMVGAALCAILPTIAQRLHASREMLGRAALLAGCLAGLFYLSHQWRHANSRDTRNLGEQLDAMATESQYSGSVVEQLEDRLRYLWVDALAADMGRTPAPLSLTDSLWTQMAAAIPGVIWPGKYDVMPVTCELALMREDVDLACTPVAESMVLGGYPGVAVTVLCWSLALAVISALALGGTPAAIVLATIVLQAFLTIESSAFPEIRAARQGLQCGAMLFFASLLVRALLPSHTSQQPSFGEAAEAIQQHASSPHRR